MSQSEGPAAARPRRASADGAPERSGPATAPTAPGAAPPGDVADLQRRIVELERSLRGRTRQLEDVSQRLRRLERRIDRASASFPVRTALRLRRRLHRLLKSTPG